MADGDPQMKDTVAGLLRRTGPAAAELLDPNTGAVFAFDFARFAEMQSGLSDLDGREYTDWIFKP